ncbi:MAG: hypothetical protein C5B49_07245 [Bdellovibrio sp.]|nr:MAG: hypothetical protein C5B49_07245 [Bdellovibrio sp.]
MTKSNQVISKKVGGLLEPAIMAMTAAEYPWVQPHLYDSQIPPVVFLSGTLLFIGGLAVVRSHGFWRRDWTVLVTTTGWIFIALGLVRMFAASSYQSASAKTSSDTFMALEAVLFAFGSIITFRSYTK